MFSLVYFKISLFDRRFYLFFFIYLKSIGFYSVLFVLIMKFTDFLSSITINSSYFIIPKLYSKTLN
jgi:hypothetical protein